MPAGDSVDAHVQEPGICLEGGNCRSQFNLITDANQHRCCWFPRGAGINSVSLHKPQCCEAGTYLSDLADNICLLRLCVSLLKLLLPQATFPAFQRALRASACTAVPLDGFCAMQIAWDGSLRGFNLWTRASTSDLWRHGFWTEDLNMDFASYQCNTIKRNLWLRKPTICGMEIGSRSLFFSKVCGQPKLCVEEMGKTDEETARRL